MGFLMNVFFAVVWIFLIVMVLLIIVYAIKTFLNPKLEAGDDYQGKLAGSQHFTDKDYKEDLFTFHCPVCDKDAAGKKEMIYDRGYDRKRVICVSCQTKFYGDRNIIIDDPLLTAQERGSKSVLIQGQTYYQF